MSCFQLSIGACSGGFVKIYVHFKKISLDFRLALSDTLPYRVCRLFISSLVLSKSTEIIHRLFGGVIPATRKMLWSGVIFKHPIISRQDSFSATSTFFVWVDLHQTGLAYYPTEK